MDNVSGLRSGLKLAGLLLSKGCDQKHEVHLEASNYLCTPGTDAEANTV